MTCHVVSFRAEQCSVWDDVFEHEGKKHRWLPVEHADRNYTHMRTCSPVARAHNMTDEPALPPACPGARVHAHTHMFESSGSMPGMSFCLQVFSFHVEAQTGPHSIETH